MKRTLALILALVMVFALAIPAMATGAGSITVKGNDSINVEKGTFTAYKMLNLKTDSTGEKYAYTVPAALKAFYADYFDLDTTKGSFDVDVYNAIAALDKNDVALRALAKAVKESGAAESKSGAGVSGANEYVISGLDDGYYLVYDSSNKAVAVSAIMIDTVKQGGNVDIDVKADAPSIQKWIVKEDGSKVKGDSASLDETITFEIDSAVPSFEGYSSYTFEIVDAYERCFVMDLDSIEISIDGTVLDEDDYTVTPGGYYNYYGHTITCDEDEAFTITFADIMSYTPGDKIVITYSSSFVDLIYDEGDVVCLDRFFNDAYLKYSSDPNTGATSEVRDYAWVCYCGIAIIKTDKETGDFLPGAEFEITGTKVYYVRVVHMGFTKLDPSDERYNDWYEPKGESNFYLLCEDGEYRQLEKTGGHTYDFNDRYWFDPSIEFIKTTETVHATGVTGDDGMLYFFGLGAGEYTITELNAPDGYNKLAEPIVVNIEFVGDYNSDPETNEFSSEGYESDDSIIYVPIENSSGVELPSTGGIGTTIFYIVGGLLVIGAAVVLVSKKRMSAEG